MPRYRAMTVAKGLPPTAEDPGAVSPRYPEPSERAVEVARASVKGLQPPDPSNGSRYERLVRGRTPASGVDPQLFRAVVEAAATLCCRLPDVGADQDRKRFGVIKRFLVWAAFDEVIDPVRAFTREAVDEHLRTYPTASHRSRTQYQVALYAAGRLLHPRQYPPSDGHSGGRVKARSAATPGQVQALQTSIRLLPDPLRWRAQTVFDLTYGAGARSPELRTLRGNAIAQMPIDGRVVSVVTLPNTGGGVREVPVLDRVISTRLLELAVYIGDRLVLAPQADVAERNIVNRISSDLRRHGHPGIDPVALRNRWVLNLATAVPAALLIQLVDTQDLRVIADHRKSLPHYKIRHIATILKEATQ